MTIIVTSAASEKASFSIQIPESLPSPPPTYRTSSTSPTEPHAPPNPPPPYLPTDQLSPSFLSSFPTLPYIRRQSNRSASALNKHEGRKAIVLYVILATVFLGLAVTLSGFKIANGISRCISDGEIVLLGDEYGTPNDTVTSANNRNDSTDSDTDGLTGIFLPDGNFNNTIQDQQMVKKCTELQGWTIAELVYGVVGILLYDFCILIFISVERPLFSVRILNLLLALHFVWYVLYSFSFAIRFGPLLRNVAIVVFKLCAVPIHVFMTTCIISYLKFVCPSPTKSDSDRYAFGSSSTPTPSPTVDNAPLSPSVPTAV